LVVEMMIAANLARLRIAIAFALAIAVAWVPSVNAITHGLSGFAAIQSDMLPTNDHGDHGHSHDDEDNLEWGPLGHVHDHDATDHSHDSGHFVIQGQRHTAPLIGRSRWPHDAAAETGLPDRLERPPRALV
jgi:hypothetical protein